MKVRLEIISEDGIESTSVEFSGKHWKRWLLAFIAPIGEELTDGSEPSPEYSNSTTLNTFCTEQSGNKPRAPIPPVNNITAQPHFTGSPQHMVQQPQQMMPQHMVQQPQQVLPPQHMVQQPQQMMPPQHMVQQPQQMMPPQHLLFQQQDMQHNAQQVQYQQQPGYNLYGTNPGMNQNHYYGQPMNNVANAIQHQPPNHPQRPAIQDPMPARNELGMFDPRQHTGRTVSLQERMNDSSLTINERLELFLKYEYPRVWFSSQDVQQHYERIYGPIKQSTVSTYLSRMYQKELLERRGNRTQREYRYIGDAQVRQQVQMKSETPKQFHRNYMEYG